MSWQPEYDRFWWGWLVGILTIEVILMVFAVGMGK